MNRLFSPITVIILTLLAGAPAHAAKASRVGADVSVGYGYVNNKFTQSGSFGSTSGTAASLMALSADGGIRFGKQFRLGGSFSAFSLPLKTSSSSSSTVSQVYRTLQATAQIGPLVLGYEQRAFPIALAMSSTNIGWARVTSKAAIGGLKLETRNRKEFAIGGTALAHYATSGSGPAELTLTRFKSYGVSVQLGASKGYKRKKYQLVIGAHGMYSIHFSDFAGTWSGITGSNTQDSKTFSGMLTIGISK